ncbi:MAG: 4Fe-4S binding protein [Tissierellia bacterium]|nr:4Fe-4S binding protein [Tissierellia bacterium]
MNKQTIIRIAKRFTENSQLNYISKDVAIRKELAGMKIFDEAIFAFGSAEDKGFELLKNPSVIGEHFLTPTEWLPGANTVIVYFFPFTDEIIKSNRKEKRWPSDEWLHGRIEGQIFLKEFSMFLNKKISDAGYDSIIPTLDSRFISSTSSDEKIPPYSSNWSERHAAFVSGLGTFGLSKGIITEKGMAGRLGSIVTNLELELSEKNYRDVYEYCTICGACAERCPVNAISIERGKDHKKCADHLDITSKKFKPRYGCGKCQVLVPCERRIPKTLEF